MQENSIIMSAFGFFYSVFDSLIDNSRDWQRLTSDDFFKGDASGHYLAVSKLLNIAKDCGLLDDLPDYINKDHINKRINEFLEIFPKIPKQQ